MLTTTQGYNETFTSFYSSQDIHRRNGTDDYQKQYLRPSTLQIQKCLFNQDLGMEIS